MVQPVAIPSSFASLGMRALSAIVDSLEVAIRNDFVNRSNGFFGGVLASAFIVAVGVGLEGPELFHELWPNWFVWLTRNSEDRLRRFERNIKIIGLVGWLLIGIGIVGEGAFEALQNRAEGQLQTFNDIVLTDTQREGSYAIDRAGMANENASIAEKATALVRLKQLKAEKKNLELQSQLEQEKTERLKLEERYAPRRINLEQINGIANILKATQPESISMRVFVSTSDGIPLSIQWKAAIEKGGWTVSSVQPTYECAIVPLCVLYRDKLHRPPKADVLAQAMATLNMTVVEGPNDSVQGNEVVLVIGVKNNGPSHRN
jgi:hypothetical protein